MKAAIRYHYGPPETLRIKDIDMPVPEGNELLVRVHAATVNRTDCANLTAKPFVMRFTTGFFKPSRPVTGTDFAGVVETVGPKVTRFKAGDRVFGFNDLGLSSHAEYLVVPEHEAMGIIPANFSFEQAAASIEGAHYAVNFLNKVKVEANHTVLVNGGTGAIGSALVQLVKAIGAEVTATCRGEHGGKVLAMGADRVIDYTREDFTSIGKTFDFVFDAVGKSTFGRCKAILKPGGTYISSELGPGGQNLLFALTTRIGKGKKVAFPFPVDRQKSVDLVQKQAAEGTLTPLMDRTYPLKEVAEAFRYVMSGEKVGNVVLNMSEE